jgi:hypothetical protein
MYHVFWEYEVRPDRLAAFEALYGPAGDWCRLFQGAPAYRGTQLYRDLVRPTHFLTVDRWTSLAALEAYLPAVQDAYARLDEQGAALTVHERRLGGLEVPDDTCSTQNL